MIDFYETLPFGFLLLKGKNFVINYINNKASFYINQNNLHSSAEYLNFPEPLMNKIRFCYNNRKSARIDSILYNNSFYDIVINSINDDIQLFIYAITKEYNFAEKIKNEREKFLSISTELKTKCDIIEILRNREKEHLMHLKDVMNNISEGIIVFDSNGKISLCNLSVNKILDIKLIDLIDIRNLTQKYIITNVDSQASIKNLYNHFFKGNLPIRNLVLKFTSKQSKQVKYIEINSNPIYASNKLTYTIYTIKDITENKMHQINSDEQANFIKNVVNTLDIPLVVIDYPELKFRLINKKYDTLFKHDTYQFKIDDILGNGLRDVLPGCENNYLYNIVKSVGKDKKSVTYSPCLIKDDDGNDRYYKLNFIPYIYNEDKVRIHIHGSDITEEINHNMELEKLNKMKDEFFTIISHELRTPLTIIYSSLQLAYDIYNDEITENINKTLARISQNCGRLLKLINNILDISKAEAGFLSLNNTEFDIVSHSEAIVNSANLYAENKNINLIFDTNEEECSVLLDKDKYEKILLNLLSNAIKYTPERKQILVSLDIQQEYFYLMVKDQGIGIPKDKIDFIFDRFAQVNSSLSRRAEGTGLGLALVKKIVQLMGGNIEVHSEPGKGSEFIVKFKKEASPFENLNSHVIINADMNDKIDIEFSDIN
ncbi:MAG: two-component sensor histidine kinase [Clostridiaceae bacterium]|nr:two-component sensor histidine kinase [Clostridiaceae bacterium]